MTTDDPHVIGGVLLASAGTYLLLALLVKALIDKASEHRPTQETETRLPVPLTRHAAPPASCPCVNAKLSAPDETAPITTVQSTRARHRKESPRWN